MNRLRMNVQFLEIERKGRKEFGFASEFRMFERTLAISITGSTFELFENGSYQTRNDSDHRRFREQSGMSKLLEKNQMQRHA